MRDYMTLGPVPCNEECEQLGPNYDPVHARAECKAYIEAIIKKLGEPPMGASLGVKSFPHDFGTYMEVVVNYYDDDEEATEYAYNAESEAPATWAEVGMEAP